MGSRDLYKTLGVNRNASDQEIKKVYVQFMLFWKYSGVFF